MKTTIVSETMKMLTSRASSRVDEPDEEANDNDKEENDDADAAKQGEGDIWTGHE